MIHTVKGFSIVNKAEVDVFLEILWFLYDPTNVGNWSLVPLTLQNAACTFGSSLMPNLKDFEHNLASMWNEHNCTVAGTFFSIALLWDWNENWPFPVSGHCWVFQIFWYIECSTLTTSSFRIWNSSAGIPSLPLALFVVMLPKAHLITFQDVWL